jgi:hypothetical protein
MSTTVCCRNLKSDVVFLLLLLIYLFICMSCLADLRIKPDVVAPGHQTWSAHSAGSATQTCTVAGMSGTSMATPATTGVAAQIRQYFEDSMFWAANCISSGSFVASSALCLGGAFSPRGATIKALLVHSGEAMTQYNSPPPYCYGYEEGSDGSPDGCDTCNGKFPFLCIQ